MFFKLQKMTSRYDQLVALEQRVADMEKRLKIIEARSPSQAPLICSVLTSIFPTPKRTVVLRAKKAKKSYYGD